jgi:hypothetical protein
MKGHGVWALILILACGSILVSAGESPAKEKRIVADPSLFGKDTAKSLSMRVDLVLQMPPGSMSGGWAVPDPQPSIDAVTKKYGKADKVTIKAKSEELPQESSVHWYGRLGLAVAKGDTAGKVFWIIVE